MKPTKKPVKPSNPPPANLAELADEVIEQANDLAYAVAAAEVAGGEVPPDLAARAAETLRRVCGELEGLVEEFEALLPRPSGTGKNAPKQPPTGRLDIGRHASRRAVAASTEASG